MKYIKYFKESVINLSKKGKFPENFYDVYQLSKKDIGKYLNTWFQGRLIHQKDIVILDEMITLKKVDSKTVDRLYQKRYNPISITIMRPNNGKFKLNDEKELLYDMKSSIRSIDDSSFGIWFEKKTFSELSQIRELVMKWVNQFDEVNGEEFLKYCIEVGANEESIDYN